MRTLVCQAQDDAMPSSRQATTVGTLRACRCAISATVAPPAASRTLAACIRTANSGNGFTKTRVQQITC